jgi:alginate O-acetyltransferase complex protein AlgI
VGEFWSRRWHISLASWFRDYLYYPIIGGRESAIWMYLGVLVVFIASGIWHAGLGYGIGWGFVAWGLLNGLYLVFERALSPLRKRLKSRLRGTILGRIVGVGAALLVFHLVLVSWVFFRAGTIGDSLTILRRIWVALPDLPRLVMNYPFTTEHKFLAGLIAVLLVIELVQEIPSLARRVSEAPRALRWAGWYVLLFTVIGLGAWQAEVFVYMQF